MLHSEQDSPLGPIWDTLGSLWASWGYSGLQLEPLWGSSWRPKILFRAPRLGGCPKQDFWTFLWGPFAVLWGPFGPLGFPIGAILETELGAGGVARVCGPGPGRKSNRISMLWNEPYYNWPILACIGLCSPVLACAEYTAEYTAKLLAAGLGYLGLRYPG